LENPRPVRTVFLDLETTGLDPRTDEIVEIGILDEDGRVLLDTLVRPVRHRSWPDAQPASHRRTSRIRPRTNRFGRGSSKLSVTPW
jgi:DNA polymerase III epsilon subunit-like protein